MSRAKRAIPPVRLKNFRPGTVYFLGWITLGALAMTDDEIDESDYGQVGWYHVTEVDRLFRSLEEAGIRFYFETRETGLSGMDSVTANFGGSFGQGAQVLVYVHREDQTKFGEVFSQTFEPEEEKIDWRKNLRDGLSKTGSESMGRSSAQASGCSTMRVVTIILLLAVVIATGFAGIPVFAG